MKIIATNRKARRDYEILETYEAGIELKGTEVKSLRTRGCSIEEAFARIDGGEIFAYNLNIPDGPNNPSVDQPKMKVNTNSIASLIDVDHFGFNQNNGGLHKQVNLVNEASPTLQGNSVIYSNLYQGISVPWIKNSLYDLPLVSAATNLNANGGTSIFGGVIINWGFVDPVLPATQFVNANQGNVVFAIPYTGFVFGVQTTVAYGVNPPISGPPSVVIEAASISLTGFSWTFLVVPGSLTNNPFTRFYWWAIGF